MTGFANFDVLARVASSGTTTVWRAHDPTLDRVVAIKQLHAPTEQLRELWRREAALLAQLSSEHVVAVYGYVELDDQALLVEQWIDGATLSEVLATAGTLSSEQALGVIRGALLGLIDVHDAGLVHGDVSPSNIIIDAAGVSRLIDFGLAGPTGSAALPATGAYAAPETSTGQPLTPSVDVYAVAAVLALLLRGTASPTPKLDGIAEPLRAILQRALDSDPARRYADARSLLHALEESASDGGGTRWWTQAGLGALATSAVAGLADLGLASGAAAPAVAQALAGTPPVTITPPTTAVAHTVAGPTNPAINPAVLRKPSQILRKAVHASVRAKVVVAGSTAAVVVVATVVVMTTAKSTPTAQTTPPSPSAAVTSSASISTNPGAGFATGITVFSGGTATITTSETFRCSICEDSNPGGGTATLTFGSEGSARIEDGLATIDFMAGGGSLYVQAKLGTTTFSAEGADNTIPLDFQVDQTEADLQPGGLDMVSTCTVTLTAVNDTTISGTASCPHDQHNDNLVPGGIDSIFEGTATFSVTGGHPFRPGVGSVLTS
jgi:serine/threonine-protein kinase